jgi:hypothetical protein
MAQLLLWEFDDPGAEAVGGTKSARETARVS